MKKVPGDVIILHMCTKNQNHDLMIPEIWSAADIIFCHFGPFLPLCPTNNSENQNLEKMKKTTGNIILLHMCSINEDHMM